MEALWMIKLIINADDFGYSRGVNYGIMDCHLFGIVNSTTIMMNMEGTEHAIELAKKNPSLQVGIHLVLTCGKPLLQDVPSLIDEKGDFKTLAALNSKDICLSELEKEWTAQIESFIRSGLKPNHFDSHHHVHTIEEFLPVVQKLAKKFNLPVRLNGLNGIEGVEGYSDICLFDFYGPTATADYFDKLSKKDLDEKTVEIMCHPAYMDNLLLSGSSYNTTRLDELDILLKTNLPTNLDLLTNGIMKSV
jgi:predicted glycoside hydrolase/deacetylase ChbG (UPF0249 family)